MMMNAKILVVDDEPIVRDIMVGLLEMHGYTLDFAVDGVEAIEKVPEFLPDLILLDVMMPDMSGFEVCQHLKSDSKWRHIPIIMVTALDAKEDVAQGLDSGADDFVQKPFNNLELLARVRSMLRIKHQYDTLEQQRQRLETSLNLNRKLSRAIAHHLEELEILHEAGLRLMSHLDTDSVLSLISEAALEIIPEASNCVMHLASEDKTELLPVVFEKNTKIVYPSLGIETIVRQAIDTKQATHIGDVLAPSRQLTPHFDDMRTLLVVPLIDGQHPIGALSVYSSETNAFQETHRHILSILANQAVTAITKARYFEDKVRTKEEEKRQIRRMFKRYLSPTVVDRLVSGTEQLRLGGKRQDLSVMFADIRDFTAFSESLPSEKVVEVLNHYFGLAVDAIQTQEGTLDKFMGDAVMALFNAPLPQSNHTLRAVRAALAMQKSIRNYNKFTDGHPPLEFGIGIHFGQAVVGNVGTPQQMDYTAIGDAINVAQRLQEQADGGQILISQAAYEAVQHQVIVEDLGPLRVKGRLVSDHYYVLTG